MSAKNLMFTDHGHTTHFHHGVTLTLVSCKFWKSHISHIYIELFYPQELGPRRKCDFQLRNQMSSQTNGNEPIELFPDPKPVQSADFPVPRPLPGFTPASTATVREILQDQHKRFHCFFNDRGFHKCVVNSTFVHAPLSNCSCDSHTSPTAIALWYLAADSDAMKAA